MKGRPRHRKETRPGSSLSRGGHHPQDAAGGGKLSLQEPQADNLSEGLSVDYILKASHNWLAVRGNNSFSILS